MDKLDEQMNLLINLHNIRDFILEIDKFDKKNVQSGELQYTPIMGTSLPSPWYIRVDALQTNKIGYLYISD